MPSATARPDVLDLSGAGCGRPSRATFAAVHGHLDLESEIGGYPAEAVVADVLEELHTDLGTLLGHDPDGVALVASASHGLRLLLMSWPLPVGSRVGVLPGEWGPALEAFAHHDLVPDLLPSDEHGVLDLDGLARVLTTDPPAVVHLDQAAAHRGLVQPVEQAQEVCRAHGVPLWVDAAQSLGHLPVPPGLDAVYAPSRKWLAGPRGGGVLAVAAAYREHLRVLRPASVDLPVVRLLEGGEADVAARVGFATAVCEALASGPERYAVLAEQGAALRDALVGLPGWQVVDAPGVRGAIVGLRPTSGQDVAQEVERVYADHALRVTAGLPWRAPIEMTEALLRLSPARVLSPEDVARVTRALAVTNR